jgi:hypothetical protein
MAAHRYWRLYVTEVNGAVNVTSVRELELHTTVGGADVTGTGTAFASGADASFPASAAFDNTSTPWRQTAALPVYVGYDFGAGNDKDIVEISITAQTVNQVPVSWQLQYSDDFATWTPLYTVGSATGYSSGTTLAFSASDTPTQNGANTFWRVNVTATDGGGVAEIGEIEFKSSYGGADLANGGKAFASTTADNVHTAAKGFNNSIATAADDWFASVQASWLGYRFAAAQTITHVAMTAPSSLTNAPKSWSLQYWDGAAYQTAFTVTNDGAWSTREVRIYTAPGVRASPNTGRPGVFVAT